MKEIEIENIKCACALNPESKKIAYLIYPEIVPISPREIKSLSTKYGVSIVVIYIPADGWNDMLTPWAEPGETPTSPPFAGKASELLSLIQTQILAKTEEAMGLTQIEERDLIGVSLSGLFTLWQWLQCNVFKSIACLSGSFWYNGFLDWFEKQTIPEKDGKAYFLLGIKEPKAWIKAYRTVGVNTETIVERLKEAGINTEFEWVPGDHYADPSGRLEHAFIGLYK